MKIKNYLIIAAGLAFCALAPLSHAQCPQICESGFENTALGVGAFLADGGAANTAIGYAALPATTTGVGNTASGCVALARDTTGSNNVANGDGALFNNTTASNNTAVGDSALYDNTTGSDNTANGSQALMSNTIGSDNTATGYQTLFSNTTGGDNTANGVNALELNTTGNYNTANGWYALHANTTGYQNSASGAEALYANTAGNNNTASGVLALNNNTIGSNNTASGYQALGANTTSSGNTALGNNALSANTTGGSNIAVGDSAGSLLTTGNNNIDIGNAGVAAESNIIRIGTSGTQTATFIAGIHGVAIAGGQPVTVSATGQLGIRASSVRFKENIKPMDKASQTILSLHPVSFRYKKALDPNGTPQFGLIAEEVAKVAPDLVTMDDRHRPLTVRYDEVNAMLLNEFLKEHRRVEQLEAALACQKSEFQTALAKQRDEQRDDITALTESLNQQTAQILQMSARITTAEAKPRVVVTAR